MTTIRLNDEIVSRSRNLRGVLDYARKHGIARVRIAPEGKYEGLLFVEFTNWATSLVRFSSFGVLREFVQERAKPGHGRKIIWPEAEITSATLLA